MAEILNTYRSDRWKLALAIFCCLRSFIFYSTVTCYFFPPFFTLFFVVMHWIFLRVRYKKKAGMRPTVEKQPTDQRECRCVSNELLCLDDFFSQSTQKYAPPLSKKEEKKKEMRDSITYTFFFYKDPVYKDARLTFAKKLRTN